MEGLDATVIAPAVPEIARAFGTSPAALSGGITAYLIAVAIFIPVSGWAADRFGARNVFCVAIGVFTAASVLCGLSSNLTQFVLARILQGIAGAMMSPVGRMEVLRKTPKERFMRAIALVSWPGLSAFVVGPPLGGFITTYVSWHWIFFINVPLGLLGGTLVFRFFSNEKPPHRPFDWTGFASNGAALAILMYGLQLIGNRAGDWRIGAIVVLGGLCLGGIAVQHARRHEHPLVSLTPLRMQTFSVGFLSGGGLFRLTIGASGFLFPTMFQIGMGKSAFDAGLLMLALASGDLAMKMRATFLVRRFGLRPVLTINGLLVAVSTLAVAGFTADTPFWAMCSILFIAGMFRSQQFTALSAMAFADIPRQEISNATALSNMIQQVAFGLGVALSAILLVVAHQIGSEDAGAFTLGDFRVVVCFLAGLALVSVFVYLRLHPHAGASVSGHLPATSNQVPGSQTDGAGALDKASDEGEPRRGRF
jgi:EmrB/QacA subfamily drug resistance transporter